MKKVVVAEASPTIKSVADSLLRQNGYDVVCTSDGLQAWEVVSAEKPDLVLIGQGLTGISGLELCRQITADRITGGIPVVLMIGSKDAIEEDQIVASGARGKLRKPFSPKDLLDVADRLAGQIQAPSKSAEARSEAARKSGIFNTQVSSNNHQQEKQEPYNLEWLDLNEDEVTMAPSKVASFDVTGEEQGLVIDDDQYGLSSPQYVPEPEVLQPAKSKMDEDYEWFLGEIKKEMEGKRERQSEPEPSKTATASIPTVGRGTEAIKYDDIAPADEQKHPTVNLRPRNFDIPIPRPAPKLEMPPMVKIETEPRATKALSEVEIALLADKIAAKLASQIAAKIDRSQIIDAVKDILGR